MKSMNSLNVKWGEIYLCNLGNTKGSVQTGVRPVLVIQNNIGNEHSPTIVVATITSVLKKLNQPTHILLDTSCGLKEMSMVMLEQIRTIDKSKELIEYVGEVTDEKAISKIQQGMLIELNLNSEHKTDRVSVKTLCPKCLSDYMKKTNFLLRRVEPLQIKKDRCDRCQVNDGYSYFILRKKAMRCHSE